MFYLRYISSELWRRRGRTIFTALGLGVGVGLVVAVSALSSGLSEAQSKILKPLTGVGTDMSVTRPVHFTRSGSGGRFAPGVGGGGLSEEEREQLRKENGGGRLDFGQLGKAGEKFNVTRFITTNLGFSESEVAKIDSLSGVSESAGGLTVNMIHLSGTVPQAAETGGFRGGRGFGGGPPAAGGPVRGGFGFQPISVAGVDASKPSLGAITPGQIVKGSYLGSGEVDEAVLSQTYASQHNLSVGSSVTVGAKKLKVVGIASSPLGGQSSDIYMPLTLLQKLSGRKGRINAIEVRADSSGRVSSLAAAIKSAFPGSQTTTAQQLASKVTGSLVDAKKLSSSLGTALAVVALLAAFLIASLLTLSSVNKRTREIGTLKAVGWRQSLVIRQISGEAVAQGLIGGVVGAVLGVAAAAAIGALGITLTASVAPAQGGFGGGFGPFGQGGVTTGSSSVALTAPVGVGIVLLAVALAVLGGLVAGAVGGARAARLRPAEALRSVE